MNIPFMDVKASYASIKTEIDDAIHAVMESGSYILGPQVEAFENEFASYCGAKYCVGVANGLDALRLSLMAWDIGPGDEVIVPAHTFIATWLAMSQTGARPVPVEPDPVTMNMDPARLASAITRQTKAIIPVHLYGRLAHMEAINAIARQHSIKVLEDAAQAHGANFNGNHSGSLGDGAAFSFYPVKNLGAFGDGGAVVTSDAKFAARIRMLANYGSDTKYDHAARGLNSRLDELQAAILRVKLKHLDDWNQHRRVIAAAYHDALGGGDCVLPSVEAGSDSVWHLYVIQSPHRDRLRTHLEKSGIGTMIHYPIPPHCSGAYQDDFSKGQFPITERLAQSVLSLPLWPQMETGQVEGVIAGIRAFQS